MRGLVNKMDPFCIPLKMWRNLIFQLPLTLKESDGVTPLPITGYTYALLIAPVTSSASFGTPTIIDKTPVINTTLSTVLFTFLDVKTSLLVATTQYKWIVESKPPGSVASPLIGGPIQLFDAPVYPS